jgi:RNA polymerase sigma-70 factor (ECF subfamily)
MDIEPVIDERPVAGLYGLHRVALVRFATALVGPDDAADVVSNAMGSLIKSNQLAVARDPSALMHRAVLANAKSMQRSGFRRRAREQRFADRWIEEQPNIRPDVVNAVVKLSAQQRACVYLTYWEDLTPQMVADRLGIGSGTVKKYLARARATLREVLDD